MKVIDTLITGTIVVCLIAVPTLWVAAGVWFGTHDYHWTPFETVFGWFMYTIITFIALGMTLIGYE